jgi:uncharacterized YigZ family protein
MTSSASPFLTLLTPVGDPQALRHLGVYESRGSVFDAHAARVDGPGDVEAFVQAVRDEHPQARHVCYAAVYSMNGGDDPASGAQGERMSDDGEPSGTAAKPILEAIRFSGVRNCAVAVSRKFGGTLLGAGGLVRAYSSAASQALAAAPRALLVRRRCLRITVGYPRLKTLDHLADRFGAQAQDRSYTQEVTTTFAVDEERTTDFEDALTRAFAGRPDIIDEGVILAVRPDSEKERK